MTLSLLASSGSSELSSRSASIERLSIEKSTGEESNLLNTLYMASSMSSPLLNVAMQPIRKQPLAFLIKTPKYPQQ